MRILFLENGNSVTHIFIRRTAWHRTAAAAPSVLEPARAILLIADHPVSDLLVRASVFLRDPAVILIAFQTSLYDGNTLIVCCFPGSSHCISILDPAWAGILYHQLISCLFHRLDLRYCSSAAFAAGNRLRLIGILIPLTMTKHFRFRSMHFTKERLTI